MTEIVRSLESTCASTPSCGRFLHPAGSDEPCPPANARKKSPEVPAS